MFVRDTVEIDGEEVTLFSATVKGKSLKRKIKVVIAELKCGDKVIRKIFFSTDLDMKASEIFLLYHSRFRLSSSIAMRSKTQGLNIGSPLMPTDSPLATTHPFPQ